jgi:3-isopropylmalate/(R)-2-methylmalate dehydratase small subunit
VVLPAEICEQLMADAALGSNARITVDLERQVVVRPDGQEIAFEVDAFRKNCLLNGLDDIGLTLEHAPAIAAYEAKEPAWMPVISGV